MIRQIVLWPVMIVAGLVIAYTTLHDPYIAKPLAGLVTTFVGVLGLFCDDGPRTSRSSSQ